MNDPDRQQGLWSIPGDGVLARQGSLVLLSSIDRRGFVEALLGLLASTSEAGGDGRGLTDAIGQAVENDQSWGGPQPEPGPAILAFGPAGAGLAVMVSGTAWAEITTAHGTHRLVAGQPSMLLRSVVGIPVQAVRGGLGGQAGADRTDRFSRLDSGTIRASGLSYSSGQAAPARTGSPGTARPAPVPAAPGPPAAAAAPSAFGGNDATPPVGEPALAEPYVPEPYPAEPYAPEPYPGEPASFEPGPEFGQPLPPAPPPFEPAPAAPQPPDAGFGQPPPPDAGFGQPPGGDAGVPAPAPEFPPYEPDIAGPPAPPPTALGPATPSGTQPAAAPEFGADEADGESGVPLVVGVYCKNGHFGDPDARSCAVCGTAISKRSSVTQRGPRPTLGVLVLDDGATVDLDGDYIIGREPTREPSVSSGEARPLRVVDAESTVSRVHARVHLDGWQVLLTDLGSANGTRIQPPGAKSEQPLDPQVPVQLRHGTRVFVGAQGIRYEPPRS